MKKTQFLVILVGVLFLLSTPALALTWTDTFYPEDPVYMSNGSEYDYWHDITDDGFTPGSDYVGYYKVDLKLSDDFRPIIRDTFFEPEYVSVSTGFFSWQGGEETYEVDFNYYDPITHDQMSVAGWLSLNVLGVLNVQLEGVGGDFYFYGSRLTASDSAPVPEPGTIVLMGLGLVGLAGMGRKKLFKK